MSPLPEGAAAAADTPAAALADDGAVSSMVGDEVPPELLPLDAKGLVFDCDGTAYKRPEGGPMVVVCPVENGAEACSVRACGVGGMHSSARGAEAGGRGRGTAHHATTTRCALSVAGEAGRGGVGLMGVA